MADDPQPRSGLPRLLDAAGRKIEGFGLALLEKPGWVFFQVIVLPLSLSLIAGANLPSWLYLHLNKVTDPALAQMIATIVDAVAFVLLPTATLLLTSGIVVQGLIARQRVRDRAEAEQQIEFEKRLEGVLIQQVQASEDRLQHLLNAGVAAITNQSEQSVANVGSHMNTMISAWSQVVQDDAMRAELKRLIDKVAVSPFATDKSHRIVLRSLLGGMVGRLSSMMDNIGKTGSFMDPEERRSLTNELFEGTSSYHILFNGIVSPIDGIWRWHADYLDFLKSAAQTYPRAVTWTFIDWDGADNNERQHAIESVKTLGIDCYLFCKSDRGDLQEETMKGFLAVGPFFEVFGEAFNQSTTANLTRVHRLTWKATSLRKRTSSINHEAFEAGRDRTIIGSEGIWSTDDISKLVRIGIVNGESSEELQVLDKIRRRRVKV